MNKNVQRGSCSCFAAVISSLEFPPNFGGKGFWSQQSVLKIQFFLLYKHNQSKLSLLLVFCVSSSPYIFIKYFMIHFPALSLVRSLKCSICNGLSSHQSTISISSDSVKPVSSLLVGSGLSPVSHESPGMESRDCAYKCRLQVIHEPSGRSVFGLYCLIEAIHLHGFCAQVPILPAVFALYVSQARRHGKCAYCES